MSPLSELMLVPDMRTSKWWGVSQTSLAVISPWSIAYGKHKPFISQSKRLRDIIL